LTVVHCATTILSACESYVWQINGNSYTCLESGQYVDGTDTLILTILHGMHDTASITVCGQYMWHGQEYIATGSYTYDFVNDDGCASTETLHLTITPPRQSDTTVSACDHFTWWRNGATYSETGDYVCEYTDDDGCTGTDTLHLTIGQSVMLHSSLSVCDSFAWHGSIYYRSDTLRYVIGGTVGCDTVEEVALTVVPTPSSTLVASACDSYSWYEHTDITTSTDTLTHRFPHPSGCDSVVHLRLTVYYSDTTASVTASSCGSYDWNGLSYTSSGDYQYHTSTIHHCDSVITLHLTIYEEYTSHLYDTICAGETYLFNGVSYDETGDYTTLFSTIHGCDSLKQLHLTVRPLPHVEIVSDYACEQEQYWLRAVTDGGRYSWSSVPGGHQLSGHEHDAEVVLRPRDTTVVSLTVDYADGHSCPNDAQTVIVPVFNVTAAIECHPGVLSRDQRTLTAIDASSGHTAHEWYADGLLLGSDPYVVCTASDDARELVLTLVAYNDYCADTAKRVIRVVDETLFVPNVFTPSLSTNNTFRAYGTGILEFRIVIYNREGLLMFESDNLEEAWDGTHDGTPCPQANYVYRIRYRGELVPDGWKDVTGSIMLLR